MTGCIYFLLSYVTRLLWKDYLKKKSISSGKRSLVIVTSEEYIKDVVENIKNHNYEEFYLAGIMDICVGNGRLYFDCVPWYICRIVDLC